MKRVALLLVAIGTLWVARGLDSSLAIAEETHTLTGTYNWDRRGRRGALKAVFTATGEKNWDVSFHFTFRGERHVWRGSATGSLTEGELEGKVLNENRRRTFTFSGRSKSGEFRGTHAEVEDGHEYRTGTLTLG